MGDGGDGIGRAWVVEVILQVIVRAGKEPPRWAWILFVRVGTLEVFSDQYSLGLFHLYI